MISAVEALKLPSAQLTSDEVDMFNRLALKIATDVMRMTYCGSDWVLDPLEATDNVINALSLALRPYKFNVMAQKIMGEDRGLQIGRNVLPKIQAWAIKIVPMPEAYTEASAVPALPVTAC